MIDFLLPQLSINIFLQNLSLALVEIMRAVTFLGEEYFYMVFMPLLYWCIDSRAGFRVGAMLMFSNGIVGGIKMLFHAPRPYWLDTNVIAHANETSFGLPSGHSSNAASVWGVLAYSFKKRWVTAIVVILILLMGLSRMVLGVHFLADVIAGWLLGLLMLLIFIKVEKPVAAWYKRLALRDKMVAALFSSTLLILPAFTFSWLLGRWPIPEQWAVNAAHPIAPFSPEGSFTIAGTWAGFLIGASWFTLRFGLFNARGLWLHRVLRFMLGVIGVFAIWFGLDQIFPDSANSIGYLFRYIRYAAVGFWVSGLAPLIFLRLKLASVHTEPD